MLYIDDEQGLLDIAKLFLERDGEFAVTTVLSAEEALASSAIPSYDAIVSDYQMPGMDGIALLKEVRKRHGDIPFILFTGRGREEVVIEAINNGADFYLQKGGDPIAQFAELAHKIRQAVQRRKAEGARRESEEKYRTLFETTGTAMVLIEEDTTLSLVNNEFLQTTGYTREEIENRKKWTGFVVKEDLDRMLAQHELRRMDHDKALRHYEFGLLTKSGAVRDIYLTVDTIPGTKKSVASLLDITERKRAEEALRESEAKFRSIVETSPDIIWEIDARGTTVYLSPGIREMMGFSPEEIIGRSFVDMLPPSQKEAAVQMFKNILARRKTPVSFEIPVASRDGHGMIFEIRPVLLTGSDGAVTGLRGVAVDITGRREAEENLKENERMVRAIFDSTFQFTGLLSPEGFLLDANRTALDFVGKSREEVINRPFWETPWWAGDEARVQKLQQAIRDAAGGAFVRYEVGFTSSTGSWVVTDFSLKPLVSPDGTVRMLIAEARDITERKQAEEKIHASEVFSREVINGAKEGIVVYDRDLVIRLWNRFMEEMTGLPAEVVLGKRTADLFLFLSEYGIKRLMEEALTGVSKESDDFPFTIPSTGKNGWVRGIYSPHYDAGGRIIGVVAIIRDITRQKKSEEALAESEAKYRALFSAESDAVFVVDQESGTILDCNDATVRLYGYRKEELVGQPNTLVSSEPDPTHDTTLHPPERIPVRYHHKKDGTVFPVEISLSVIPLHGRNVLIGAVRDITERVQAEETLRTSEENYRSIIENMQEMFYRSDCEGNLTMVTPAGARLAGYDTPDQMIGKNIADFWTFPEGRKKFLEALRRDGSVRDYPATVVDRNGSIHYLSANCHLYKDKNGTVLGVEGLVHDITSLKKAEEALRIAREKYSTIFRQAPDAITISDLETGEFIEVNNAATRIFGYSREELVGHNAVGLGIWQSREEREAFVSRLRKEGHVEQYESLERRRSGELFYAHTNADTIAIGDRRCFLAIIRDVTEQKVAQEALKKARDELEARVQERTAALRESEKRLRMKLDSVLSPDVDISELELSNILDVPQIQSLMVDFSRLTGMGTAILDLKGNVIEASGWQEICTKFHRANEKTAAFCRESDLYLSKNLTPGQFVMYKCKNGLWDVVTPLYIGTKHAGNIYTGQFFMAGETVDENSFLARADEFGFDRDAYLAALARVPRFTRKRIEVLMDYMVRFTGFVSRLSYSNLKLAQAMARQEQAADELRKLSEDLDRRVVERTAELSRAQEAYRKANEKLNLLTSITRHDIRNQLTVLQGFLELSARSAQDPPAAREFLQKGKKAVETIRHQIEFTKVYQDLGIQAPAWQDVEASARQAARELDLSRVSLDIRVLSGVEIFADPLLPRVFFNLFDNTLRYGGEKMGQITVASQDSGDSLVVVCEDDGKGIGPDEKERIFERGYGKNTGLGLFLVRQILGITGITIEETGTPDKGTRFEIRVPAGSWRKGSP